MRDSLQDLLRGYLDYPLLFAQLVSWSDYNCCDGFHEVLKKYLRGELQVDREECYWLDDSIVFVLQDEEGGERTLKYYGSTERMEGKFVVLENWE